MHAEIKGNAFDFPRVIVGVDDDFVQILQKEDCVRDGDRQKHLFDALKSMIQDFDRQALGHLKKHQYEGPRDRLLMRMLDDFDDLSGNLVDRILENRDAVVVVFSGLIKRRRGKSVLLLARAPGYRFFWRSEQYS